MIFSVDIWTGRSQIDGMTVGRPLTYDPEAALDAAMEVFWSQGYDGTSLQDLLTAMELSKSSFYQAFGGKKELFLRCMGRYRQRTGSRLRSMEGKSRSGLEFIETLLLSSAYESRQPLELRRGCLLMNTASEFAQRDGDVATEVATGFEGLRSLLTETVRRGQAEGEISSSVDPNLAASYLISTLGGLKTMVKGGANEQQVRGIVEVALRALR